MRHLKHSQEVHEVSPVVGVPAQAMPGFQSEGFGA